MSERPMSRVAAALSCVGMLVSPSVGVAAPAGASRDVQLHAGGVLLGQLVDTQGVAQPQAPVSIRAAGKEIASVQTDRLGNFAVANLQGGVYEVAASGHHGIYRLWAPQTAPPAAQRGLMLVSSNDLVRGQNCGCGVPNCGSCVAGGPRRPVLGWMVDHPIITGAAIAAAIAIPIAVSNDDDDYPPVTP